VTAFSSKFDAMQAGKAQFTPQEQMDYDIFRGKAQLNRRLRHTGRRVHDLQGRRSPAPRGRFYYRACLEPARRRRPRSIIC
jgi:cytochrome c peroxidase